MREQTYWRIWNLSICILFALWAPYSEATLTESNSSSPDLTTLPSFPKKPRIFILSDILNEPDDSESLVRYLLYSNEFDTQGICAVTSEWLPNSTHPEAMKEIVNAYGEVVENLNNHVNPEARYSNASDLIDLVTSGPSVYGKEALSQPLSDGASKLLERLEASQDPLWVTAWGGVNTLAQALQHLDNNYNATVAADLRSRLRVFTISDQDDTGPWIRTHFPDVFYIVSVHAWNSYVSATWVGIALDAAGSNTTTVTDDWLAAHIQRGPLGTQYPTPVYGMEGDTSSFLYLIPNGLGDPEHPDWGSWGGRYGYNVPGSRNYHDTVDEVVGTDGVTYPTNHAGIWRWRDHYQHDFAARIQWSLTSDFANASHPPVPVVNGTVGPQHLNLTASPGASLVLDAGQSYDPDHAGTLEHLSFQWYQYLEPTSGSVNVRLEALAPPAGTDDTLDRSDTGFANAVLGQAVRVRLPSDEAGLAYHVVLQVSNEAHLARYVRVVINV